MSSIEELVEQINACDREGIDMFVCDHCKKLFIDTPIYLDTSKWGYQRPFCGNCVKYCDGCHVHYSFDMEYQHDRCEIEISDDSSNDIEDSMYGEIEYLIKNNNIEEIMNLDPYDLAQGSLKTIEKVLKLGYDVDCKKDDLQATLLMVMCWDEPGEYNTIDGLKLVLKYGADINASRMDGYTALFLAVKGSDNKGIIDFLLKNGADVCIRNIRNETVIDYIKRAYRKSDCNCGRTKTWKCWHCYLPDYLFMIENYYQKNISLFNLLSQKLLNNSNNNTKKQRIN